MREAKLTTCHLVICNDNFLHIEGVVVKTDSQFV